MVSANNDREAVVKIPQTIKNNVANIIDRFNKENGCQYQERYRGEYLYLDKIDTHGPGQVCRLKFNGGEDDWSFAIYKYSSARYDSEEIFFPGEEYVNGTVEGALKAGLLAYPPY